mmetsp:Transcript_173965/g.557671  ORF Transcript_173965/g.557671 Transcript_173965/m.557671 type:complete len:204 (-) Transcript_173965:634-1245(-)
MPCGALSTRTRWLEGQLIRPTQPEWLLKMSERNSNETRATEWHLQSRLPPQALSAGPRRAAARVAAEATQKAVGTVHVAGSRWRLATTPFPLLHVFQCRQQHHPASHDVELVCDGIGVLEGRQGAQGAAHQGALLIRPRRWRHAGAQCVEEPAAEAADAAPRRGPLLGAGEAAAGARQRVTEAALAVGCPLLPRPLLVAPLPP